MARFQSYLFGSFLLAGASLFSSAQATIMTDIVMIVDESGSMGAIQKNLRNNIGRFANILSANGQVDARYALVGYGNSNVRPRMLTDFTSPVGFAAAGAGLQVSGGTEPGYTATAFALNELDNQSALFSYRANSIKNLIIFTDEPHNGSHLSFGSVNGVTVTASVLDGLLKDHHALFNAVLSGRDTVNSYQNLALSNYGAVFDLSLMNTTNQAVVERFVDDFAQAKLKETVDYCTENPQAAGCQAAQVPVPAPLGLLGVGAVALVCLRRRQRQ